MYMDINSQDKVENTYRLNQKINRKYDIATGIASFLFIINLLIILTNSIQDLVWINITFILNFSAYIIIFTNRTIILKYYLSKYKKYILTNFFKENIKHNEINMIAFIFSITFISIYIIVRMHYTTNFSPFHYYIYIIEIMFFMPINDYISDEYFKNRNKKIKINNKIKNTILNKYSDFNIDDYNYFKSINKAGLNKFNKPHAKDVMNNIKNKNDILIKRQDKIIKDDLRNNDNKFSVEQHDNFQKIDANLTALSILKSNIYKFDSHLWIYKGIFLWIIFFTISFAIK